MSRAQIPGFSMFGPAPDWAGCQHSMPQFPHSCVSNGTVLLSYVRLLSHVFVVSDSAAPWTVDHQAPLFMEFSRQEHWIAISFRSS